MDLGMFLMPAHPPENSLADSLRWDLESIRRGDELGFAEAWVGQHFTLPWEPVVAPDLLIAQAAVETSRIRLAPGAYLLPYHHPVELAHRIAQLDHMLDGRLMVGVGASSTPTDLQLFDVDGAANENRRRMAEALDIMIRIWEADDDFDIDGEFWRVRYRPHPGPGGLRAWLKPLQRPYPPLQVAGGLSVPSSTLRLAGERGLAPLSFPIADHLVRQGWDSVEAGSAAAVRSAERSRWGIVRDVLVAETDAEARRLALADDSPIRRFFEEYYLPLLSAAGYFAALKHDLSVPDAEVTCEYLVDRLWLVGSPDTVAEKIAASYEAVGGFGRLLMTNYDFSAQPEVWWNSMGLLADEVMPKIASLTP